VKALAPVRHGATVGILAEPGPEVVHCIAAESIMMKSMLFALLLFSCATVHAQDFRHWAPSPPMGWNSWDCFGPTVTEQEVKANADYMADHLKKAGWQYIVVDIRWYVANDKSHGYNEKDAILTMDEHGRFLPAVNRFPSSSGGKGFKPLADYIHGKGLKFGMHIMRGIPKLAVQRNTPILGCSATAKDIYSDTLLCKWLGDMYSVDAAKKGAQEYYNSLFELYAAWGVDFVKVDDLSRPYHKAEIEMIRRAIDCSGRPIVLSTSPGETPIEDADHVIGHANMWRIIDDFWDNWAELRMHFALFEKWIPFMGAGHWPDGDMLPLGRIGIRAERGDNRMSKFSRDEQYTLMSLFFICRSPLMFGRNLPDNDPFTLDLMTNEEALAVLQHSRDNRLLFNDGERIAWIAADGRSNDKYVALFYAPGQKTILEKNALWSSPLLTHRSGEQSASVNVNIKGSKKLYLVVTDGGNGTHWDHADWIEPKLTGKKGTLNLTDVKWSSATSGWGSATIDNSVGGNPLVVDNASYARGIGTHAASIIEYVIPDGYDTFSALVGLDKECIEHTDGATIRFHLFTDHPTGSAPQDSASITLTPEQLGLKGRCIARDLWAKKDLGEFSKTLSLDVRSHGAVLLKIGPVR
jgi:alpha-galactosidase